MNQSTFILTHELTTRTTPEMYGIAGTCPTDSRTEGRTVRIMDGPILSTEDTSEDPFLSTEDTGEETSLSTEDTAEEPSLSTEDTAEEPSLSTENTAEEPSLSTEDTTIFRCATNSLS